MSWRSVRSYPGVRVRDELARTRSRTSERRSRAGSRLPKHTISQSLKSASKFRSSACEEAPGRLRPRACPRLGQVWICFRPTEGKSPHFVPAGSSDDSFRPGSPGARPRNFARSLTAGRNLTRGAFAASLAVDAARPFDWTPHGVAVLGPGRCSSHSTRPFPPLVKGGID